MRGKSIRIVVLLTLAGLAAACGTSQPKPQPEPEADPPMADIHLHFNWNQEEVIAAEQVIDKLLAHNVVLAVVTSVPSDNAIKLREAGGDWIVPFFSPYITGRSRDDWYMDERVPKRVQAALESGRYFGIGEVHLMSGLGPRRSNPIFQKLLDLAREHDVPMMLHTDASSYRYFLPICRNNPEVRFLWAHAGGILGPVDVGPLMDACSNVWVELSARDPWHYGGFTDADGRVPAAWVALFRKYPDRFMTGTDPVWNAHQVYRWYEADEGWDHYSELNGYHRDWLDQLPADLESRIRLENARRFLGVESR